MKFIFFIIFCSFFSLPVFAQESNNPSLIIDIKEIPSDNFNIIARDATIIGMEKLHEISWQLTIDNNLIYSNPNGTAVVRIYDKDNSEKFVEIGMGSQPDEKFWVAVQTSKEGYVIVHRDLERGWSPLTKVIVSYTEKAGLTVNNGVRIVVSNLDIGPFAINAYSVHGMESYTDPPAINSGSMIIEFLSGDPTKNTYALFPFYIAAGMGVLVGVLYLTKKRS